jgi:uncharacterized protein YkwD
MSITVERAALPRRRLLRRSATLAVAAALALGPAIGPGPDVEAAPTPSERVIEITNARRVEAGRRPVTTSRILNRIARAHSVDQASHDRLSHYGSDGSDLGDRLARRGYDIVWAAENVASGYPNARLVMRAWMASAGHRANILSRQARRIGVGVAAAADGTLYWTMVLARPA